MSNGTQSEAQDQDEGTCTECYLYGVLAALAGSTLQAFGLQLWKLHFLTQERAAEAAHLRKFELRETRREQKRAARRLTNQRSGSDFTPDASQHVNLDLSHDSNPVSSHLGFADAGGGVHSAVNKPQNGVSPATGAKQRVTHTPARLPAMIPETSGDYNEIPLQEVDGSWLLDQSADGLLLGDMKGAITIDGVLLGMNSPFLAPKSILSPATFAGLKSKSHHRRAYSDEIDLFRAEINKALVAEELDQETELQKKIEEKRREEKKKEKMAWQQHATSSWGTGTANKVSNHRRYVSDQQDFVADKVCSKETYVSAKEPYISSKDSVRNKRASYVCEEI